MKTISHINSGNCPKCEQILNSLGGTYPQLKEWFKVLQGKYSFMHISCAGRSQSDQDACKAKGTSKSSFGESAHNYSPALAIDLFATHPMHPGELYPKDLFKEVMDNMLAGWLQWYGEKDAIFYELPHIQVRNWKKIVIDEKIKLIYS